MVTKVLLVVRISRVITRGWQDCIENDVYEIVSTLLGENGEIANARFVLNHKMDDIAPILANWFPETILRVALWHS